MIYELGEVFVPAGYPTHTYVERATLKQNIRVSKMNKSRHINIFGSTKTGKSNLWKKHYLESNVIKVGINISTTINDIYEEILTDLQVFYEVEKTKSKYTEASVVAEIKAKISLILDAKAGFEYKQSRSHDSTSKRLVEPIISANTVCRFLKGSGKVVVIEDFHYADSNLIKHMAQDLKNFSDEKCQFIFVSIKHMVPQLLLANQKELQGRLTTITVGNFSPEELKSIITNGCNKLEIAFSQPLIEAIVSEATNNAALVQDICQKICFLHGIEDSNHDKVLISDMNLFSQACIFIAREQEPVYIDIVNAIRNKTHGNETKQTYVWLLKYIQQYPVPDTGIHYTLVHKKLQEMGHATILLPSVSNGLRKYPEIMESNKLNVFFSYNDETKIFKVEDVYLQFVFKWLPSMVNDLFSDRVSKKSD